MTLLETTLIYQCYIMIALASIAWVFFLTAKLHKISTPVKELSILFLFWAGSFTINLALFLIIDCKIISLLK